MTPSYRHDHFSMPPWAWLIIVVGIIFCLLLFVSIFTSMHPGAPFIDERSTRVDALASHLQIFEAFLAALAIGLAVFGVVGYNNMRNAAMSAATEIVSRNLDSIVSDYLSKNPNVIAAAIRKHPELMRSALKENGKNWKNEEYADEIAQAMSGGTEDE